MVPGGFLQSMQSIGLLRLTVLCFCLTAMHACLYSQNLVPNSNLEDSVQCPATFSQIIYCRYWFSPNAGTPDYFHTCNSISGNGYVSVPTNGLGAQSALSGFAYVGIGSNIKGNVREYLCVRLTDSLEPQGKYCISFFWSLAGNSFAASNSLGVTFLSDSVYVTNADAYFFSSMVSDSVLSDTSQWHELRFNYLAVGGEKYLLIGILQPDSLLQYQWLGTDTVSSSLSYYYIDDVSVWNCDTPATVYPQITFFPNPSNGNFSITGNFPLGSELKIYNVLGQQVSNTIRLPEGNQNVPIYSFLAAGVYCCRIESQGVILKSEMIVVVE